MRTRRAQLEGPPLPFAGGGVDVLVGELLAVPGRLVVDELLDVPDWLAAGVGADPGEAVPDRTHGSRSPLSMLKG